MTNLCSSPLEKLTPNFLKFLKYNFNVQIASEPSKPGKSHLKTHAQSP